MKNIMKKILTVLTVALLITSLTACKTSKIANVSDTAESDDISSKADSSESSETDNNEKPFEEVTRVFDMPENISFEMPDFYYEHYYDSASGKTLPYRLHIPNNYNSSEKYPVLFWLHGAGERGDNNTSQINYFSKAFETAGDFLSKSIIIAPQCPSNGWWNIDENGHETGWLGAAMHLLYKIKSEYSCDSNRIYVSGLSMGGYATWSVLERYGDVFAAGAPICGWGNYYAAQELSKIPIWIYHGDADPTVSYSASQEMYNAISRAGSKMIHLTTLYGVGHNAWDYALTDRNLFCWMFAQSKSKSKSNDDGYKYVHYIRIVSPKNETVFTDEDIKFAVFSFDDGKPNSIANLTDTAAEQLRNAYKNNMNQEFTVYYCGFKLYSFKPLRIREDNDFSFLGCLPPDVITSILSK